MKSLIASKSSVSGSFGRISIASFKTELVNSSLLGLMGFFLGDNSPFGLIGFAFKSSAGLCPKNFCCAVLAIALAEDASSL